MHRYALLFLIAGTLVLPVRAQTDRVHVATFSSEEPAADLPRGWQPLDLRADRATKYDVVKTEDGRIVVRADAQAAASGLVRRLDVDPAAYPMLEWSWKVTNVLEKGDVTRKSGDDYPARVYVVFDYDPDKLPFGERMKYKAARALFGDIPVRALSYVWESRAPEGTLVPNPYTAWVQMKVVQSGSAQAGQWVTERHDVVADYRRAFGEDPPPIAAVAIVTDTDNTGESATAYYGDIVLRKK